MNDDGADIILSFDNPGATAGDRLYMASNLNSTGIATADAWLARVSYAAGNAVIDTGAGNSLTLIGVAGLTVDDFAIV